MERIEIFFEMLSKAESKNRKVIHYDSNEIKYIWIFSTENEGRGKIASLEYTVEEEEIPIKWWQCVKFKEEKYIRGCIVDIKTGKRYYIKISEKEECFKQYFTLLNTHIQNLSKIEICKKDGEFNEMVKRETK